MPNTGYVIDEEGEIVSKNEGKDKQLKIVVRGMNDLIESGVTTEKEDEEND